MLWRFLYDDIRIKHDSITIRTIMRLVGVLLSTEENTSIVS
jgi:hypothetical protein